MAGVKKALAEAAAIAEAVVTGQDPSRFPSPAVLEKMKAELRDLGKKWENGETSSYSDLCYGGCFTLEGNLKNGGHGACHSWVSNAYSSYAGPNDKNFLILNCHKVEKSKASKEATKAILRWMASESPFAKYILNRADEDSLLNDGPIILAQGTKGGDEAATLNEALWMCKILRLSTEGSRALDTWYTLYQGGVNPFLSLLIANHISTVKGAVFGAATVGRHCSVFHYDLYGLIARPNLEQLMKGEVNRKANNTSSVFTSTPGTVANDEIVEKIAGFCKPYEKSDGWGGVVKGKGADKEALVTRALEWQRELEGAAIVPPKPKKLPTKSTVYLELDM